MNTIEQTPENVKRIKGAVQAAGLECLGVRIERTADEPYYAFAAVRVAMLVKCPCRADPITHSMLIHLYPDGPPQDFLFTEALVEIVRELSGHIEDDVKKGLL